MHCTPSELGDPEIRDPRSDDFYGIRSADPIFEFLVSCDSQVLNPGLVDIEGTSPHLTMCANQFRVLALEYIEVQRGLD